MYGAIIGDIAGSTIEFRKSKRYDIPFFLRGSDITDDTIMTVAVADALMQWRREGGDLHEAMRLHMRRLGRKYPPIPWAPTDAALPPGCAATARKPITAAATAVPCGYLPAA